MVLFNYATKELTAKVVYYGPGLCGKTTNLQWIYDTLPGAAKGKMLSLATKTDRTLFFDFLPIDLGKIRGMKTKIQLYTVPGQVFYDTTRKLVLKGADGVVFVADSQEAMLEANIDSYQNLITNLKEQNIDIREMPHVIQYNKRDMKNALPLPEIESRLNRFGVPYFEAVAPKGAGVFETLKGISKVVLQHLSKKYGLEEEMGAEGEGKRGATPPPAKVPGRAMPDLPTPPAAAPRQAAPAPQAKPQAASRGGDEIQFEDDASGKAPALAKPPVQPAAAQAAAPQRPSAPPPKAPQFQAESQPQRSPARPTQAGSLQPLPNLDNSEVVEMDDVEPMEIEEMREMAEIAKLAKDSKPSESVRTAETQAPVAPIEIPVAINLPTSLAGKPIRLQIDISFSD